MTSTQTYRLIPSTMYGSRSLFQWDSDCDAAGGGNEFADSDAASMAADSMDRTSPVEGGEWLIAVSSNGRTFTVLTSLRGRRRNARCASGKPTRR